MQRAWAAGRRLQEPGIGRWNALVELDAKRMRKQPWKAPVKQRWPGERSKSLGREREGGGEEVHSL